MSRAAAGGRGLFIVFEGPDGAGKTGQTRVLLQRLLESGYDALGTREPGGTSLGEMIREIMLHDPTHSHISPRVEALLFSAARSQHIAEVIGPALDNDMVVVCDRFKDSTTAYQGGGSGMDPAELEALHQFALQGLEPDLVVLLDLDVEEGLRRKHQAPAEGGEGITRIELRGADFHRRVRDQFLRLAAASPDGWLVLSSRLPVEELSDTIWRRVTAELESRAIVPMTGPQ